VAACPRRVARIATTSLFRGNAASHSYVVYHQRTAWAGRRILGFGLSRFPAPATRGVRRSAAARRRARAVRSTFELSSQTAEAIVDACRRLHGIPQDPNLALRRVADALTRSHLPARRPAYLRSCIARPQFAIGGRSPLASIRLRQHHGCGAPMYATQPRRHLATRGRPIRLRSSTTSILSVAGAADR
jgi:hypothetical protein